MDKKISYKVQNWSSYNKALVNRGDITLWFDEAAVANWYSKIPSEALRGRPKIYSDECIELALTLRALFDLPLRGTQGFLIGILKMLELDLRVPNFTRLSRRKLNVEIKVAPKSKSGIDIVVDSTGLKIYGEGEWKMRIHGKQKRRTWRKLHLAIDPKTFETVSMELTEATAQDDSVMKDLLKDQSNINDVFADGAYVSKNCFDAIAKTGAKKVYIALRTGTSTVDKNPSPGQELRNNLVRDIRKLGGKTQWKKKSRYHKRSLVETQMFRFKTLLGGHLKSRNFQNQTTETRIKVKILNKISALGMPKSLLII